MARAKKEEVTVESLQAEIANLVKTVESLNKEVAALKKAKPVAGGKDERVDVIISYLKERIKEKPVNISRKDHNKKLADLCNNL